MCLAQGVLDASFVKSETLCALAQRGGHELIVLMVMPPVHRSMANRRSPSIG